MAKPDWPTMGIYHEKVVGESYHMESLEQLVSWPANSPMSLVGLSVLSPEPDNKFDTKAVAIFFEERKIGYLCRESAIEYHSTLGSSGSTTKRTTAACRIERYHHDEGVSYSIWLDMSFHSPPQTRNQHLRGGDIPKALIPRLFDFGLNRQGQMVMVATDLEPSVVRMCAPGQEIACWSPPESDDIYLYAPGSVGGSGRVGVTDLDTLKKAGFEDDQDFRPIIHSASGHIVVLCAKLPDS